MIKTSSENIVHRTVCTCKGRHRCSFDMLLKRLFFHCVKQRANYEWMSVACRLVLLPSHCPWLGTDSNSWLRSPYGVNAIFITAQLHLRDGNTEIFFSKLLWRQIGMLFGENSYSHRVAWKTIQMFVVHGWIVWNSFEIWNGWYYI